MPQDVNWESARRIANEHAPKLRPKVSGDRWNAWDNDRRAWRLLLTATVLEAELPELDGWVPAACGDLDAARDRIRTTPGAFLRGCLARWLEYKGYCPEKAGMHLLGRLQHALLDHVAWFEQRRQGGST